MKSTIPLSFELDHSARSLLFWTCVAVVLVGGIIATWLISQDAYIWLGKEDALGENLTAIFYLIAGGLLLLASIRNLRSESTLKSESLQILLALFFFFIAGEEISWGQRILGFATPEAMLGRNVQGEFNIHNYDFFSGDLMLDQHRIFALFIGINGVLLPLCYVFWARARRFLNAVGFPIMPLCCMGFFVLPLIQGRVFSAIFPHWANSEVVELAIAAGILLFGVSVLRRTNRLE